MSKPWGNAIKFGLLAAVIVFYVFSIIFQSVDFSSGWALLFLLALSGGVLTGLFAYDRARISDLEYRLEYLEEKLEKLKKS